MELLDITFNDIKNKFSIINTTSFVHFFKITEQKNSIILDEINKYGKSTGIMIGNLFITPEISIYLFLFDYHIIIIEENDLTLFFNQIVCKNEYFYLNSEAEKEISEKIKTKTYKSMEDENFRIEKPKIDQKSLSINIKKIILNCIIKKAQIRTLKRRLESKESIIKTDVKYKYNDFVKIKGLSETVDLCFNVNDQFLYVLKNEKAQKQYEHEITFYQLIDNKSPFICKYYGKIETEFSKIIILEYIEGDTLLKFIKKKRNQLSKFAKIKIILDLLIGVELIHSKNIIIRDLKIDNIIVDSNNNAILIDFDQSSLVSKNEIEKDEIDIKNITGCIGSDFFASPEQFKTSKYSQKADIYSLGMCIHFIITEIEFDFNIYDILQKSHANKCKNNLLIFEEIQKCASDYEDIQEVYEHCLDFVPELRPNASEILGNLFHYIIKNGRETADINIIIYYLTLSANSNNSYAQYYLGIIYYFGKYIQKDINKSIYYLTLSSNQNNSDAQYYLGIIYYFGKYIQKDINKSIYYLTLSANQNNSDAQYFLGVIYYDDECISRDINKSIYYLTLSANQNNSYAQYYLGMIYYNDNCISRDINKSIYYFTLSANQNNSDAQFYLGVIYYDDNCISRDINKSVYYLTLSANQNNSYAQYYLGMIYYNDNCISRDINKSIYYFTLSSNQNNSYAQFYLGVIYYDGKYIQKDINKSIYYLTLSANQNNSYAQFYFGVIYYDGKYILKDINKSIYYFTLSANQNNSYAQFFLGLIYCDGKSISRDINKSIYYLTLSANQNYSEAQYLLGMIYYEDEFISMDINKSIYYFKLAANQNNSYALFYLGFFYYSSNYASKDIDKSIYYLKRSSDLNNPDAQFMLGLFYYINEKIPRDINKSFHYLTLSANQNYSKAQFFLGIIYYSGEHVKKDINKSIHYFKEASCYYDNRSKNNLGVIYKNGYGVKKNIYNAIEYFEESIRQKNDLYSTYNLLRIYYFGIDVERNFEKMNHLIENIKSNAFYPINIFLFFIYTYGDKTIKNEEKSKYYKILIDNILKIDYLKNILSYEYDEITCELLFYQRLQHFLKFYDLEYVSNKFFRNDFAFYMCKGIFHEPTSFNEDNNKINQTNINEEFYKGFYDK